MSQILGVGSSGGAWQEQANISSGARVQILLFQKVQASTHEVRESSLEVSSIWPMTHIWAVASLSSRGHIITIHTSWYFTSENRKTFFLAILLTIKASFCDLSNTSLKGGFGYGQRHGTHSWQKKVARLWAKVKLKRYDSDKYPECKCLSEFIQTSLCAIELSWEPS